MTWGRIAMLLALVGCTKSNPAKHCTDGTCSDPAYPFCDVSGTIAGEAGACIAAACTADAFVECRGDVEVRCNPDGSNYNLVTCDRGCDDAVGGCRLCGPGETACTNGKVATCDATGAIVSSEDCPLGCFESEPRCREIDPSNDLATYFDMVASPPSVTLENAQFDTSTGEVTDNGQPVTIPSFAVSAPVNGVPLRIFIVDQLTITQADAIATAQPHALAILARGPIVIVGRLGSLTGSVSTCAGGAGTTASSCTYSSSASGGGGFATNGAKGGDVVNASQQVIYAGGAGGIANGNERLVPLRGGCASGPNNLPTYTSKEGGSGGGAIQLVSSVAITVDGVIDVAGQAGGAGSDYFDMAGTLTAWFEGGGAGGGILLEAPLVTLGPNASLDAKGGDGTSCTSGTFFNCSASGAGGRPGTPPLPGSNITCDGSKPAVAGGGGGGLGRIRINTANGFYTKASTTVENGALTAGMIETR